MFLLDVIFVLFTLHYWPPMNMCPIRQHTLYNYLTGSVKTPSILILSCNTPYSWDTLRDIKSFKTNLSTILKSLTLSNTNRFKDTENHFHFLVSSSSFLFFSELELWTSWRHSNWCSGSVEIGWLLSTCLYSIHIILLLWIIATKP